MAGGRARPGQVVVVPPGPVATSSSTGGSAHVRGATAHCPGATAHPRRRGSRTRQQRYRLAGPGGTTRTRARPGSSV
jgi:hypothetical protein